MNEGSVPLRPLWPGSMPTVIPASGAADGCRLARGVALLVAGEARKAAGEATASPATPDPVPPDPVPPDPVPPEPVPPEPVPPDPVAVLAHAVTRQATAASSRAWLARVRRVLAVRSGSLSSAAERVDVLNLPPAALMAGRDREHRAGVAGLAGAGPGVLLVGEDEQPGPVAVEHLHPGVGRSEERRVGKEGGAVRVVETDR